MARYQIISSLLLLVILVAHTAAEAPRRLRNNRQRQAFARQVVQPTPYPSADELKPEEPALIYGPPPSTEVEAELPAEREQPTNSFQPDDAESVSDTDAEALEPEETTPAAASARLRNSRQRLAKLRLVKTQSKRQRIARLEAVPVPVEAPVSATPQFYYINAQQQQPFLFAYNPSAQQLSW